MEAPIPQAKPRLVRLAGFRVGIRPGRTERCVRTAILVVLDELVGENGILTQRDVVARLNPAGVERRQWAIERALWRMAHRGREGDPKLEVLGSGRYRAVLR